MHIGKATGREFQLALKDAYDDVRDLVATAKGILEGLFVLRQPGRELKVWVFFSEELCLRDLQSRHEH